ncbi:MmgE/PrpD family protein [Chloroflexota bacterium]
MEATEKLARFVVETGSDKIPVEAVTKVKHRLLDTLGVALAGSQEPIAKIITNFVKKLGGEPAVGVIGGKFRTSAPHAALANGTMAHALDYDDSVLGQAHNGVVLMPTIFTLAEELGSSGKEAIEAYVLGIEVWVAIANSMLDLHLKAWHPTNIFGTMGAATAASKLLKLNVEQTVMALGIAGSQSAGLLQNFGTMTKPFHAGNAARSGIMAAMLAKDGFTASKNILDGDAGYPRAFYGQKVDVSNIDKNLGKPFAIVSPSSNIKMYPCCYASHRSLNAMFHLIEEYDIKPDEVESVDCQDSPVQHRILFYTDPTTELEAKFSMQFPMAAALIDRQVGLAQFNNERVNSPDIKSLMKRISLRIYPDWVDGTDHFKRPATVTVKLKNGKEYSNQVLKAKGHADVPLSWDELLIKYRDCAGRALNGSDVERSIELLADLEKLKDLKELMAIVTGK